MKEQIDRIRVGLVKKVTSEGDSKKQAYVEKKGQGLNLVECFH